VEDDDIVYSYSAKIYYKVNYTSTFENGK